MRKAAQFLFTAVVLSACLLSGCGSQKEAVLIYTSTEDYVMEDLASRLEDEFPDYDITIEYMLTGNHAAKLLAEGANTACDIVYDLEYAYMEQLAQSDLFADLSDYDMSVYSDDTLESDHYAPIIRSGGAIILNTKVLEERGLEEPSSYQDLLKPKYAGLISMPDPKSSSTGFMFLKSLVNAWGEDTAFEYFSQLSPNVLQYTSSGSGPVNALVQGEVAIGLGMISQAVIQINEGLPLKILFFEEGAPFSLYGQAIISGKETRMCVKEVFDYLMNDYSYILNEKFFPEQLFDDTANEVKNYPQNISYSDMRGNTIEEKERLLRLW